ncbi:hypothetical protein ACHQM5_023102 [Ranunculus cassubicifolius]
MNTMISQKNILSQTGSAVAIFMLIRTITNELAPFGFRGFLHATLQNLFSKLSSQLTMVIEEVNDLTSNQIYTAAEIYLGSKTLALASTRRFKISKNEDSKTYAFSMEKKEEIVDIFQGVKFNWRFMSKDITSQGQSSILNSNSHTIRREVRYFELQFHKKHKEKVLNSYLPHILDVSKAIQEEQRVVKLHTVNSERSPSYLRSTWSSINLSHPATFEKLAMDDSLKKTIMDDLERFVKRKEFYGRVGKVWKRGYLLYGPPGTGKSSLIAAMANYLNFDIYDLELTDIRRNSDLRRLLLSTSNRSILVIEDIDCSIDFQTPNKQALLAGVPPGAPKQIDHQVTLSGMLNFIDGLWSSCGDERIIVFTTNHKDRLDPALLRPGRMDVHIHMSYCTPCGFRLLAYNYIQVSDHPAFKEIEELLEITKVTPAEIAEVLMKNEDPDITLGGLLGFLKEKQLAANAVSSEMVTVP